MRDRVAILVLYETDAGKVCAMRRRFSLLCRYWGIDRRVVVNNAKLTGVSPVDDDEYVEGSNFLGEFSGWNEGLARLGNDFQKVLLINDTIFKLNPLNLSDILWIRRSLYAATTERPQITGLRHRLPQSQTPFGWYTYHLNSRYLVIDRAALQRVAIVDPQIARHLADSPNLLANGCYVPGYDAYSQILDAWLHTKDGWYRAEPLSKANAQRFLFKAAMILSEHRFSQLSEAAGTAMIDMPPDLKKLIVKRGFGRLSNGLSRLLSIENLPRP